MLKSLINNRAINYNTKSVTKIRLNFYSVLVDAAPWLNIEKLADVGFCARSVAMKLRDVEI